MKYSYKEALKRIKEAKEKNSTSLDLSNLELEKIPEDVFPLANLTRLELHNNKISIIPNSLAQLTNLTSLSLANNQISTIPDSLAQLTNLTELNLKDNQINSIPDNFAQLANLTELYLTDNQLKVGKEVYELPVQEQITTILKWQAAEKTNQLQPIHEAKVIFIGQSNYGKTHLIELLREGEIKREITTTHGIERSKIEIDHPDKPIRINFWDLGGQEFMRSTHQFFFSERTLYVLVTLARKERTELNHWLKLANQLGNNAPVLVVINKIDQNPHDLDRNSLQRDYPNIIGFVRTTINDCPETTSKASINKYAPS